MNRTSLISAALIALFVGSLNILPAAAQGRPAPEKVTPAQREVLLTLFQGGGILIHADDRQPDNPVVLVDFTNHPALEESWLSQLDVFPKLATIGLRGTGLTDAGLGDVARIRSLEVLDLADTKITDEGVLQLKSLTKLRTLDLSGTRVSADAVSQLRQALPSCEITWQEPPKRFSAAKLEAIRVKARKIVQINDPTNIPQGWSKSTRDPNKLLALFPQLKLRPDFTLRAYQFNEEFNGQSVIWALPKKAEFPEPADCPRLDYTLTKIPKPLDALSDVMEAIEGDDTPTSYLAASVFKREMQSFGVLWHGMTWDTHALLDKEPTAGDLAPDDEGPFRRSPIGDPDRWTWSEDRPRDWAPQVKLEPEQVTVTFYSYSCLYPEGYYRHTDVYRRGNYRARSEDKLIAEGKDGLAF